MGQSKSDILLTHADGGGRGCPKVADTMFMKMELITCHYKYRIIDMGLFIWNCDLN